MPSKKPLTYQVDMPYAKQPFKAFYVSQRLFTSILMCLYWAVYYAVVPRSYRPRPSWTIKCILAVNFTRRIYKVTELAGVTWGTRDPEKECSNRSLKHTRFEWVDPMPQELRTGIVADPQVPFKRVGCFVWPKMRPKFLSTGSEHKHTAAPSQDALMHFDENARGVPIIGLFLHGGGYCHLSAHENAPTSQIPARLVKDKAFTEIYSVEYRLLQHAPFPAAVQDAATVYANLVRRYQRRRDFPIVGTSKSSPQSGYSPTQHGDIDFLDVDGSCHERAKYRKENEEIHARVSHATASKACKIILIGDSAGGNLVLALARWIRDEGVLPPPDGLLLLSPSCDPSHAFPETPSSYVPRPHASTDYLVDTPEPRALLQRTFLGHNPIETMHSPYVSPASPRVLAAFYGNAFASSVSDLTIAQLNDDHRQFLRTLASAPATPVPILERSNTNPLFPAGPPEIVRSYSTESGTQLGEGEGGEQEPSPTLVSQPVITSPRGMSLFSQFAKTCVVLGDAERLEREVAKLVGAMERDGTELQAIWVKDAPHDVLQMKWWDERVRDGVWAQVEEWVARV